MSKGNVEITNAKDSEHFDVLIVGGGLTGLMAARKLINTDHEVLVVEQDSGSWSLP